MSNPPAGRPRLTLMADYGCFTWTSSRELFRFRSTPDSPLDLEALGASPVVVEQLAEWHAEWERAAYGDPPSAGDDAASWERRGWTLARQLQGDLPWIDIEVWDELGSRNMPIPDADASDGAVG